MKLKMAATPEQGICVGCRSGQVMEHGTSGTVTLCNNGTHPFVVARPVTRCTDFVDRKHEPEWEMRKIAWTLNTDKRGKLGFHPPAKTND